MTYFLILCFFDIHVLKLHFMKYSRIFLFASLLTTLILFAGCNRGPKMVKISGKITIAGETFDQGLVQFDPADGVGPSEGTKIKDGFYEALVPPGEKIVRIRGTNIVGQQEMDPVLNPGVMVNKYDDVTVDRVHWAPDDTRITVTKAAKDVNIDFPAAK